MEPTPLLLASQVTHPAAPPKRSPMLFALPILGALVIAVGALAFSVLGGEEVVRSTPPAAPPEERPVPAPRPEPVRIRELPPPTVPPTLPPPPPALERPKKSARIERPAPPPKRAPPPPDRDEPQVFKARAMKAWRAHQQRGNQEWAEKLQSVVIDLQMRAPSPAEERLVREAEAALR